MEKKYSNQYKILQEFRRNLKDVLEPKHTDEYLLTFLRANNFDIRKAEKMIRLALSMRALYQMDKFVTDYQVPEVAAKYEFTAFLGFDKEGSTVRYLNLKNADFVGFVQSMSTFEIGCYAEYVLECDRHALEEENRRTGRSARGYCYILDMAGFSLHQLFVKPVIETGLDLMKIFQDLHPEDTKAIYCVNAPIYFYAAYNIFKPILRLNLLERIHVFSKDTTPEKLLKVIDPEVLPRYLGGTRVDPDGDPLCPSIMQVGGKIPEEYYKMNREYLQENDIGVKTFVVPARSFYETMNAIEKPGSLLRLEFRTEHYGIGLWLMYKPFPSGFLASDDLNHLEIKKDSDDEACIISSQARIQSHVAPVDVLLFCERPGLYIFHYDNTFSMLQSKRIIYRTEVYPPAV